MIVAPETLVLAIVTLVALGNTVQVTRLTIARRRRYLSQRQRAEIREIAREELGR